MRKYLSHMQELKFYTNAVVVSSNIFRCHKRPGPLWPESVSERRHVQWHRGRFHVRLSGRLPRGTVWNRLGFRSQFLKYCQLYLQKHEQKCRTCMSFGFFNISWAVWNAIVLFLGIRCSLLHVCDKPHYTNKKHFRNWRRLNCASELVKKALYRRQNHVTTEIRYFKRQEIYLCPFDICT